jgi:CO/xanthine dehydrogenase Mo-binding subunit
MSSNEMSRIQELFDNLKSDKYPLEEYQSIGKRGVRRIDGYEKATGYAKYTMDVQLPGMLYARFLTCPYPHAEIKSLDTSKAEALPGVRAVLRYDDPELPAGADLGGHETSCIPVLPKVAHFQGEEVGAIVAADSEEIAERALALIDMEWEERPFVLDPEQAMQPGAPLADPESFPDGNITNQGKGIDVEEHGDVEKGFAEADKIIEFKFRQGLNTWIGPERPCGVFRWNGEYPEVWVKQQRPHICKRAIASWFGGIPMNKIQVHCLYQGASFGGWSQMPWNLGGHYCAAVIAKRTGRPVKWMFSRREDFYGGEMDAGIYYFKVGAKLDGTITAVKGRAVLINQGMPVFGFVKHLIDNTKIPNVYGKTEAVWVNKGPTTATRCEQNSNCYSLNMVFSHVADVLGLDPVEVALKNDGAEGHDMAWLNERKAELGFQTRDSLKECVEKGKAAIGWDEKWHAPGAKRLPNGKMHGLGFTWTHEWDDSAGTSEMAIRIERNDGTATILGCRSDVGVNAETAYCQVTADELGMRIEDVHYKSQLDTGFFTMTPDSSTNMSVNGFAIRNAARLLKRQILGPISSPQGEPFRMGQPYLQYPFSQPLFAHAWQVQMGAYAGMRLRFCRQAHFMEVEVDEETGEVGVTRVVTVNDVGKVINWEGCEGQQYGGAYMGIGRGRSEEIVHDPLTGVMLNGNLLNYKIPTMLDIGSIDTVLVETGMGYGPYGVVGIGEDVATVTPTLIGPAVHNAIGKWVDDFPMTPDRVLKALGKA